MLRLYHKQPAELGRGGGERERVRERKVQGEEGIGSLTIYSSVVRLSRYLSVRPPPLFRADGDKVYKVSVCGGTCLCVWTHVCVCVLVCAVVIQTRNEASGLTLVCLGARYPTNSSTATRSMRIHSALATYVYWFFMIIQYNTTQYNRETVDWNTDDGVSRTSSHSLPLIRGPDPPQASLVSLCRRRAAVFSGAT